MTAELIARFTERIQGCKSLLDLVAIKREIQPLLSQFPTERPEELRLLQTVLDRVWLLTGKSGKLPRPDMPGSG